MNEKPTFGDADHSTVAPKRKTGAVIFTIVAILLLALVGLLVMQFVSRPLEISEETTYLTEPLTADGRRVDYFAALEQKVYPANMTTDENGFRLIAARLGPAPEMRGVPWMYRQTCEKLGLDPLTVPVDLTYEEPYTVLEAWLAGEEFDEAVVRRLLSQEALDEAGEPAEDQRVGAYVSHLQSRVEDGPWTLDDLPMMATWLEENGPALDLFQEAVSKPSFCIPMLREKEDQDLIALLLPNTQWMRSFVRGLQARANYRVATGDIDGAIDDILACKRLERHMSRQSTLVDMLVGIASGGLGHSVGIAGSFEHPPTKEQIQRLMDELDALPPRGEVQHIMGYERFMALDIIQRVAHGDISFGEVLEWGHDSPASQALGVVGVDWNLVAKTYNERFDDMWLRGIEPERPNFSASAFVSRGGRSILAAEIFVALFLPALDAVREAERRMDCQEHVQRLTLAMLLYELDHGTLPPAVTVDASGSALHSWRVLLLPYLGEKERALYEQIRLDEPWDSEHNAAFHLEDLPVFRCPSSNAKPGEASYRVVVGPDMPFEGGECRKLADFGPDSNDMILVVETTHASCWMDPTDAISQADADNGVNVMVLKRPGVSSEHPGGANFGLRNGAAKFLSETIDGDVFKNLLRGTNKEQDY